MDINELRDKILAVLNQATEGAKDAAGQATEGVRGFADKAAGTAKAGGRMAKLAMEIASEKEAMKKTYQEIGKLYYETAKDAPDGFFIQLFEEVRLGEQSIAEKEEELNTLKSGFQKTERDISVEFEEVVNKAEAEVVDFAGAAQEKVEAAREKVEAAVETVAEKAGELKDKVVEEVKNRCCCEEKPAEEQPAEEKPAEECCCEEQPAEEQPAEEKPEE
jgi:ElaB/YqjD/DUF883 family membrane-anchored ribosome-binding protein